MLLCVPRTNHQHKCVPSSPPAPLPLLFIAFSFLLSTTTTTAELTEECISYHFFPRSLFFPSSQRDVFPLKKDLLADLCFVLHNLYLVSGEVQKEEAESTIFDGHIFDV